MRLVSQLGGVRRGFFSSSFSNPVTHAVQRIVPFPSQQVFDIVADVNSYNKFLPFCQRSKVVKTISPSEFEADVTVGFGMFVGTYRSKVTLIRPQRILVKAIDSALFEFLDSSWNFERIQVDKDKEHCKVSFNIKFKASSPLHSQALNFLFTEIAEQQLKAFENRCRQMIYAAQCK